MRKGPARTASERMKIRVKFDQSEQALPVLGDLVREKRGLATRRTAGIESGVPANVILDVENHYSAKQDELDRLMAWVGRTPSTCQAPPPIISRSFGRPRNDGSSDKPILDAILAWLSRGEKLSKFESQKLQVDSARAKRMVARYLTNSPEFKSAYTNAKAAGAHFLADAVIDIADDASIPASQAANMIRARQWAASKANPEVYGQNAKSEVNVNVGFGEALEQLERRRQEKALPAPNLRVIDIEPLPLQRTEEKAVQVDSLASD
jgi:hypothetical protein